MLSCLKEVKGHGFKVVPISAWSTVVGGMMV